MPLDAWKNRMLNTTMKDFVSGRLPRLTFCMTVTEQMEIARFLESAHPLKVSEFLVMTSGLPEGADKLKASIQCVLSGSYSVFITR